MATSYTDLKIFRGKYADIMALKHENMTFYLSTDTNQLFVGGPGSAQGSNEIPPPAELIEYSGNIGESRNLFLQLKQDLDMNLNNTLASIGALGTTSSEIVNIINNPNTGIIKRINDLENNFESSILSKVNELVPIKLEEELSGIYTELSDKLNKLDTDYSNNSQIGIMIDNKINSEYSQLITKTEFTTEILNLNKYKSVELLINSNIKAEVEEENLIPFLEGKPSGLYRVEVDKDEKGNYSEFIIKNINNTIIRINSDGVILRNNNNVWTEVLGTKINNVNGITTEDGIITIDADDIPDTELNKWNSLVPDSDGVVNAGGRDQAIDNKPLGNNSIAIGYLSSGQSSKSVAVGYAANAIGENSIQLGEGSVNENEFQVWEYKLLDKTTGKIPNERIPMEGKLLTLLPDNAWTTILGDDGHLEQTLSLNGLKSDSLLWISPNSETYENFVDYEIRAVSQSLNTITFKCAKINLAGPTSNIKVDVIVRY